MSRIVTEMQKLWINRTERVQFDEVKPEVNQRELKALSLRSTLEYSELAVG